MSFVWFFIEIVGLNWNCTLHVVCVFQRRKCVCEWTVIWFYRAVVHIALSLIPPLLPVVLEPFTRLLLWRKNFLWKKFVEVPQEEYINHIFYGVNCSDKMLLEEDIAKSLKTRISFFSNHSGVICDFFSYLSWPVLTLTLMAGVVYDF
jgi:hypothetical protein